MDREPGNLRKPAQLAAVFGLYTVLFLLWIVIGTGHEDAPTLIIGLSHIPVESAGVAVAWWASRRSPDPLTARAWRLISVALALWVVGDSLLAALDVVTTDEPFLSPADVAYLAFYPCLASGLLSLPGAPRDRRTRLNLALDAVIVLLGASMVIWYVVVQPGLRPEQSGSLAVILNVAYPAGDLVLLFGLTVILLRHARREAALLLLLAGVAFVVVADSGYTRLSLTDSFDRGDWPDAAWLVGEYLFLVAATVQFHRGGHEAAPQPDRSPPRISQLPYAAVAVGYTLLLAVGWQAGRSQLNGLLIGAAALTAVVLIRQLSILRENLRLADQQNRLAAIVESSDDSIIASTLDGTILDWNPGAERMYGYRAQEVAGVDLGFLCLPERTAELDEALERVARGEVYRYETVRVRKDGSPVDVSTTASPIRDASGKVVGASGIDRDITERNQLETLRDEFIANAAHELRTPLATLTVLGEILSSHLHEMTPQQLSRSLAALERQGRRANTLIANLLDLSQLQGGRMPLRIEPVRVVHAVKGALEAAPPSDATRVHISVPPDLDVVADAVRLEQIFTNLLTNAYRYGGDHVVFVAHVDAGVACVSVCDDGAGVPAYLVPHLFEPFTRDRTAEYHGGSGIGLALCRRLVDALGGDIAYAPGVPKGSRFTVRLPCP
jgi:PAS domain S-box-containing protein